MFDFLPLNPKSDTALCLFDIAKENYIESTVPKGKSLFHLPSIDGPCSITVLNNQRVASYTTVCLVYPHSIPLSIIYSSVINRYPILCINYMFRCWNHCCCFFLSFRYSSILVGCCFPMILSGLAIHLTQDGFVWFFESLSAKDQHRPRCEICWPGHRLSLGIPCMVSLDLAKKLGPFGIWWVGYLGMASLGYISGYVGEFCAMVTCSFGLSQWRMAWFQVGILLIGGVHSHGDTPK